MSTFISRYSVSGSRVCGSIFKICLRTPMTRPSDGINFSINFTLFVNEFYRYTGILFFSRYTRAFCLDLFGSVMFSVNSADSVPAVYLNIIDDILNVSENDYDWGQTILFCLYFNHYRSCLEPVDCIVDPLLLLQM
jgi:hypothetical protein